MKDQKVFSKFRVWDEKKYTSSQVFAIAVSIFEDIAETHGVKNAYMQQCDLEFLESGEKVYHYEIVQEVNLPPGKIN